MTYRHNITAFLLVLLLALFFAGCALNGAASASSKKAQKDIMATQAELADLSVYQAINRGEKLYRAEKYKQAVPFYERALELKPKNSHAHYRIAQCYLALGDKAKVIKHYRVLEHLDYSLALKIAAGMP